MKITKIKRIQWMLLFLACSIRITKPEMVLDETFGTQGIIRSIQGTRPTALILINEKLIIANYFDSLNRFGIMQYNRDGSLDRTFEPYATGEGMIMKLAAQQNGKIIALGNNFKPRTIPFLSRYNTNGSLDQSFIAQLASGTFSSLALQPDEKIIVAGEELTRSDNPLHLPTSPLLRYNDNGSFDVLFELHHREESFFESTLLQPDGKIVVAGSARNYPFLGRYNTNGSFDESFGVGGYLTMDFLGTCDSVGLQNTNKIVVAGTRGTENTHFITCYNPNGTLDASFGPDGSGTITNQLGGFSSMTLQPHDGKIIILSSPIHNQHPSTLTRYNPNGSLDLTFSDHGTHFMQLPENIHGSELLFDPHTQTLVVAGSKTDVHRVKQTVILRYKTLSALETETRRLALIAREEAARLAIIAREEISRLANEAYDFLHIGSERHQCSICLEDIREIPTETACDHLFHPTCLNTWRTIGGAGANTCPTCRENLNAQQ